MSLTICPDAETAAIHVADIIEAEVRANPRMVLGLSTGRTPARAYAELVRRHHCDNDLSFRFVTTFNGDEFLGVGPEDMRSARYFMNTNLFRLTDIALENTHVPRGDARDIEAECKGYEAFIKARGGLDLAVLGLGYNGHVCFNEPGSSVRSRTRAVSFTPSTMAALSDGTRFKSLDETPSGSITLGIGTLLEARKLLLIACGIGKADAVHKLYDSPPGPAVPASQLLHHENFHVVVDAAAASALQNSEVEIEYVESAR